MLQRSLSALGMQKVKTKFLGGVFAGYSLTYQQPGKSEAIGIVWTEDANMRAFFNVMSACQKAVARNSDLTLWLLRTATEGKPNLAGYQIYREIFHNHPRHHHLRPALRSVHYLATYDSLVNSALAHELVIAGKSISLTELESLIQESKLLQRCPLLQDLKVVQQPSDEPAGSKIEADKGDDEETSSKPKKGSPIIKVNKQEPEPINENKQAKEFILNLVITQQFMGLQAVVQSVRNQFPTLKKSDTDRLIQELCQEKQLEISDPHAKPEAQLIFWLPQPNLMPKKAGHPE
jgi:hypothetical protein